MKTANLVISCADRPGLVRAITDFLLQHKTNICYLQQHVEGDQFFMRIEWEILSSDLQDETTFNAAFQPLKKQLMLDSSVDFNNKKKRVGLLCSKEPHCLIDILSRVEIGELPIEIPYVMSNFQEAEGIVTRFGIPFFYIPTTKNTDFEKQQLAIIQQHHTDLIALARYMKVLSLDFISAVGQRIINVHHSFLPSFVGAKPYDEAYERGVKLIGATSHYVIPELDQGPIIEQTVKRIDHSYAIDTLKLLGRESEKEVFAFAIRKHIENKLVVYKNRVIVFS